MTSGGNILPPIKKRTNITTPRTVAIYEYQTKKKKEIKFVESYVFTPKLARLF